MRRSWKAWLLLWDALENIAAELEWLRVLKEHELGVRLEDAPEGDGPYVPNVEK